MKELPNTFEEEIQKNLTNNNILISAHGNSIRALCKYLFELIMIKFLN